MKNNPLLLAWMVLLFSSCATESSFYMSPSDVRSTPYVTLPMKADPEKTVTAASIALSTGGSNDDQQDALAGGSLSLMQSHQFGIFQAYYGGVFAAGKYTGAESFSSANYQPSDTTPQYYVPAFDKYYGYYGFNGGVNVVVPFAGGRGEWRAIGLDVAYRREFGSYLDFRRQLPKDQIDLIALYNHAFTLGGSTEIVGRNFRGTQVSYKIAAGGILFARSQYAGQGSGNKPYYFCQTFAVTKNRVTGYVQFTVGTHAAQVQTGVNINLRRRQTEFPGYGHRERPVRERRPHPRPFERRPQPDKASPDNASPLPLTDSLK